MSAEPTLGSPGSDGTADSQSSAQSSAQSAAPSAAQSAAQRRRRLERVFGEVLPETTSDERDPDAADGQGDAWLRAQVPPHHG